MLALLLTLLCAQAEDASAPEGAVSAVEPTKNAADADDTDAPADEPSAPVKSPAPRVPGLVGPDSPHWDLEQLYGAGKMEEGYKAAVARAAEVPNDPDIYWIVARFIFERGEVIDRSDTSIDKKALYQEMIDWAEKGLKIDPNNMHTMFAYGVGKGRLGTTRGVLASLFMAKDVERSWLAVTESDYVYRSLNNAEVLPCDAHLALSIFYRLVPDWWIVKVLSGTRGDLDKALWHSQQADTCDPNDIAIRKEMGVIQLCMGEKNEDPAMIEAGKATLAAARTLTATTATARIDLDHMQKLIDDPSLACEYSRDGQQDNDRAKLEE